VHIQTLKSTFYWRYFSFLRPIVRIIDLNFRSSFLRFFWLYFRNWLESCSKPHEICIFIFRNIRSLIFLILWQFWLNEVKIFFLLVILLKKNVFSCNALANQFILFTGLGWSWSNINNWFLSIFYLWLM